jgi:S-adenosylmethionine hydrolase
MGVAKKKRFNTYKKRSIMKTKHILFFCILLSLIFVFSVQSAFAQKNALVFQTDFGSKDGAVASMKAVAFGVDSSLPMFDLTHEISAFNIWEAAYRLSQTATYWPQGTVFVSVVDPGVGTDRKSVALKTKSGHFFVSPDNGTLTLVAEQLGIEEVREIDEKLNRLKGSELSHTFHGRDVYAYTGARLAAGVIDFSEVGPKLPAKVVAIPYQKAIISSGILYGTIPILDIQYGNVWTNISIDLFQKMKINTGDILCVNIYHKDVKKYSGKMPYVKSFGYVPKGQPLIYLNDLLNVSIALNRDNFASKYKIEAGDEWKIDLKKCWE